MPPPLCAKCRETPAAEGDSWCLACTGWEALGRELAGHWDSQGARVRAGDLVISCVRQVRGLRSLSAGLSRTADRAAPGASASASQSRPRRDTARSGPAERPELPRARPILPAPPAPPPPPVPKEEEATEAGEEGEEEEEESPDQIYDGAAAKRKPPGPDRSPDRRGQDRRGAGPGRERRSDRDRDRRSEDKSHTHRSKRKRGSTHRGGRKHQRLSRLAENPQLRVHRKASPALLELSLHKGREALDRL